MAAAVRRASRPPIAKRSRRTAIKNYKQHLTDCHSDGGNTCSCSSCGHERASSSSSSASSCGRDGDAAAKMSSTSACTTPIIKIEHVQAPTLVRTDPSNFRALVQQLTGNHSIDPDLIPHHHHDDNGNEAIVIDALSTSDNCISNTHVSAGHSCTDDTTDHQPAGRIPLGDHRCSSHNSSAPKEERKFSASANSSHQMEDTDDGQSSNELYWTDQDNLARLNTILFTGLEGDQSTDFSEDQSSEDLDVILASEDLTATCKYSANSTSAVSCSGADYDCHTTTSSTTHLHNQNPTMDSWHQLYHTAYGDPLSPLFDSSDNLQYCAADNDEVEELKLNAIEYNSLFLGAEPTYNMDHLNSNRSSINLPICH